MIAFENILVVCAKWQVGCQSWLHWFRMGCFKWFLPWVWQGNYFFRRCFKK